MNQHEFQEGIDLLRGVYGDNSFGTLKAKLIFQKVNHLSPEEWSEAVEAVVMNSQRMPTPIDVIRSAKDIVKHRARVEVVREFKLECESCHDTGWIFVACKYGETWMFCSCMEFHVDWEKYPDVFGLVKGQDLTVNGIIALPFPKSKFIPSGDAKEDVLAVVSWFNAEKKKANEIWKQEGTCTN